MQIRNGRPVRDQFMLDRNGFAIIGHASAVTDFTDREEATTHGPGAFRTAHSATGPRGRPSRGTASNSARSPTSNSIAGFRRHAMPASLWPVRFPALAVAGDVCAESQAGQIIRRRCGQTLPGCLAG
jgi:hypothetical protein